MGGGGKGAKPSAQQTVTTKTEIPQWLQIPMERGVKRAENLYAAGEPDFFPGQTFAPFSADTQQSLALTRGLANTPDPYGVQGNFAGLMGGDFLYGGRGFNQALDAATNAIAPRVQSTFGGAGRNASGLAQAAMAEELGDVFAGLYNAERGRQMQGLSLAPQIEALRGLPASRFAQVGAMEEAQRERELADERARYEHGAYAPQVALDRFLSRVQGVAPFAGQTQTQNTPLYRNQMAGGLGGALAGLGIARQLFPAAGPVGLGLGAVGGGLLGFLG